MALDFAIENTEVDFCGMSGSRFWGICTKLADWIESHDFNKEDVAAVVPYLRASENIPIPSDICKKLYIMMVCDDFDKNTREHFADEGFFINFTNAVGAAAILNNTLLIG